MAVADIEPEFSGGEITTFPVRAADFTVGARYNAALAKNRLNRGETSQRGDNKSEFVAFHRASVIQSSERLRSDRSMIRIGLRRLNSPKALGETHTG